MEDLYGYLRGTHEELLGIVDRIDSRCQPAWETLLDCQVDGTWPYELSSGKALPQNISAEQYSQSTSAMILYALALGRGLIRKSPLAPEILAGIPNEALTTRSSDLETVFDSGVLKLFERSEQSAQDELFNSRSFGANDPFTLTWCSELLRVKLSARDNSSELPKSVKSFADKLFVCAGNKIGSAAKNPSDSCLEFGSQGHTSIDHPFPLVRLLHLCKSLLLLGGTSNAHSAREAADVAERVLEEHGSQIYQHLMSRVHQQLSYHEMPNAQFDAAELVFALEGALLCGPKPGAAPDELLDRVFKVIEERQSQNPYWRPLKPFVTTPQGFALLPLSVEIANSLLRICALAAEEPDSKDRFSQHLSLFTRYTDWLDSRMDRGTFTMGNGQSGAFCGWHSEHVTVPGRIHTWETSQVLIYLLHFRGMLERHIAKRALEAAFLKPLSPEKQDRPPACYWAKNQEPSEPLSGCTADSAYSIYQTIKKKYLMREKEKTEKPEKKTQQHYSALLYGPPGTGKTRIAIEMAKALQWPLITITPSDFVARGASEVEMRAKAIFDVLKVQSDAVILFDEIDRLILDRDSKFYREQGDMFQFMTPGMLTKLHDLREAERVIFLIATNYADRIDPAAKRVGRIDEKLLVTPPDLEQRMHTIAKLIGKHKGPKVDDNLLRPVAQGCALAVYGELERLVVKSLELLSSGSPDSAALAEALRTEAQRIQPQLRLTSYESRFRRENREPDSEKEPANDEKFASAQEPFEEFFVLVYLKCEVMAPGAENALSEEERSIVRRVIRRLLTEERCKAVADGDSGAAEVLTDALKPYLNDKRILQVLADNRFGIRAE